jgi:hypothetical protein
MEPSANKKIHRATPVPTDEDIRIWQKNPYDERLPVPRSPSGSGVPGYREPDTREDYYFHENFLKKHGEPFWTQWPDGTPMQHITPEMDIHEMGNVMRHGSEQVAKMHPKPKGLMARMWAKVPERLQAAVRLAARAGLTAFGRG